MLTITTTVELPSFRANQHFQFRTTPPPPDDRFSHTSLSYSYPPQPLRTKKSEEGLHSMFYGSYLSKGELRLQNSRSNLRARPTGDGGAVAKSPLRQRWRPASDRDPVPSSPQEQIIKVNAEPPMSDEKEVLWDLREVVDDVSDLGVSFDERKGRHDFRGEALDTARPEVERPAKSQSSDLLSFVAGLRDALREGDSALGVDDSRGVSNVSNKASTSKFQAESGENSRKWTIKQPRPFRPLGASRADIVRIIRMRNMSKPELSLRKEISHQEKWLRKHSGLVDTSAYRYAVQVLARNQRHLAKYKKRPTEFRDLPTGVKRRKWRFKEEMEWDDRRAEGNAFWQKFGKAGVSRRRASDLGDLVSGSFGEM